MVCAGFAFMICAALCQLIAERGVPMKQIQNWLGHSDISTTANIYAHLDSQSKNLSARTMANTLTLPEAQPIKKW
ncbi:MAG: tyrosine-type recombinase/integrase [Gemmiger sp.]